MPNSKRLFSHDGNQETPFFAVYGYTYGGNRVERWTYVLLNAEKTVIGKESEKYDDGMKAILSAQNAVQATTYKELA